MEVALSSSGDFIERALVLHFCVQRAFVVLFFSDFDKAL